MTYKVIELFYLPPLLYIEPSIINESKGKHETNRIDTNFGVQNAQTTDGYQHIKFDTPR